MSHVAKIELEIKSLESLKEACMQLGFKFKTDQKTFKWYGKWVGDSQIPEGIDIKDIGKCDHAIKIPGCSYEIGVIKKNNNYILFWDNWYQGGLKKKLGKNAGILKQAYAIATIKKEARLKGYKIREQQKQEGIRLVLSV